MITEKEKDDLIDITVIKAQGFVNRNVKERDKEPVILFKRLLTLCEDVSRGILRENICHSLSAVMPVCEECGVDTCAHPGDPLLQVLNLPCIVTNKEDIAWFLNAVDSPHNGLTFRASSLSAGKHNNTRELAKKFTKHTRSIRLRSAAAMPNGSFTEGSHLAERGRIIDLIRIFKKGNPGLPMYTSHGRMMLGDEDRRYNPSYSFYGRTLALVQVEDMMTVVDDEVKRQVRL